MALPWLEMPIGRGCGAAARVQQTTKVARRADFGELPAEGRAAGADCKAHAATLSHFGIQSRCGDSVPRRLDQGEGAESFWSSVTCSLRPEPTQLWTALVCETATNSLLVAFVFLRCLTFELS